MGEEEGLKHLKKGFEISISTQHVQRTVNERGQCQLFDNNFHPTGRQTGRRNVSSFG
jgi:hypothetical protein